MNTAVAEKETKAKAQTAEARRVPIIDPERYLMNAEGFVTRDIFVRAPKEMIVDDLKEPGIWARVQTSALNLHKLDRITIVSFDETWIAEAWVAHATTETAVLTKPRITAFPERYDRLFEDDRYRVEWAGNGYVVRRKSDNQIVSNPMATVALAQIELARQYPRSAI